MFGIPKIFFSFFFMELNDEMLFDGLADTLTNLIESVKRDKLSMHDLRNLHKNF